MLGRKNESYVCPKCGEWEVSTEDYEIDIDCLWLAFYCHHCGETWSEYYTLTYDGYTHNGTVYDANGKECTDI